MRIVEIWKGVNGYEGSYEVSSFGNIRSLDRVNSRGYKLKGRMLNKSLNGNGYYNVNLYKQGKYSTFSVHVLVAMAFLGHVQSGNSGLIVDHIDNNPLNNIVDNLQLVTNRYNSSKDKKGGSSKYVGVSWNKRCSKWRSQIVIKGRSKHLGLYTDEEEAKEAYEIELKKL
jgi:hypothetical protein